MEATQNDENALSQPQPQTLSKNAQKKLLKQQRYEAKKAEKKAQEKRQKKEDAERKRKEWEETLASVTEEERAKLIESRRSLRKERMEKRSEEKEKKMERLNKAMQCGHKIVVDLDFAHLMTPSEIQSLVQQRVTPFVIESLQLRIDICTDLIIMYCYAVNGRCTSPCHLWLTGCEGEMGSQLKRLPGFDNWIIQKENRPYIEALQEQKENLVYLTADAETVLEELELKKIYIVGGLVDRNRWKGITMKKAKEQGIQTAKLPIGNYLKMSSSQVLTVNQVMEILLKFIETKDWKVSFFQVIPQRKRPEADPEGCQVEGEENEGIDDQLDSKKKCVEVPSQRKRPEADPEGCQEVEGEENEGKDDQLDRKKKCIEVPSHG
uniref:tRNA (guanine(9)-N(1))-methyltransferase n=1 Tax=Quercus lobata TaxID=97700 RepID=A0A7N2LSL2_QUELO